MRTILLSGALLILAAPSSAQTSRSDPGAITLLNRMADVIGELHSCAFRLEASHDVFDSDIGTLVKRHDSHEVAIVGPDKMIVSSRGDGGHRGFWYDGKSAIAYSYDENNYGRLPAPNTVIAMIDSLHDAYAIDFPAADFFYPTFVADLIAQSTRVDYLGEVEVDDTKCFHIIAKGNTQDVQVWIESAAAALPIKYVIRDKGKSQVTEYEGTFSEWQINPDLPSSLFSFTPPPGAREVRVLARNPKPSGGKK
jgi:hypothetical protein